MQKEEMKNAGYNILENNQNSLEAFLKTHHPQVFRDGEFDLNELKNLLNIKSETRGYGLNFVGKSFALQKYSQETKMELKINQKLSKNFNETQNAVIRGDNLDALKILQSNYAGQVKCIYIDPPYNTKSDEFIYSDSFRTHENDLLEGYTENEVQRMEGIFKTKQSHSGWLAFMLPRLKLARDLLREDGVIFVSIDDNEQANLKLLMDEVFGEEEFVGVLKWKRKKQPSFLASHIANVMEYILVYAKDCNLLDKISIENVSDETKKVINVSNNYSTRLFKKGVRVKAFDEGVIKAGKYVIKTMDVEYKNNVIVENGFSVNDIEVVAKFSVNQEKINNFIDNDLLFITKNCGLRRYVSEEELTKEKSITDLLLNEWGDNQESENEMFELLNNREIFDYNKPINLIKNLVKASTTENDLVLDFFAGSGTTGQAVMELNHETKQPRNFILVQWNEEIAEGKEARKFCLENGLEPVISSITVERLRRAGAKYGGDVGFKVFDCIKKTELVEHDGQLSIEYNQNDDLSRVYNLVVKSGKSLHTAIETVVEGFIYKAEDGFYVINAKDFDTDAHKNEVKKMFETGQNIYIDGWTASINMTLQQYKSNEKMKIVY